MENNNKKMERSRTNRVLAGVCGGLSDYFNIDVALVRVLFVVATICGSFGFWMYVILWVFVPEEPMPEPVNPTVNTVNETIDITPKNETKPNNGAMIASLILIVVGLIALANNFMSLAWMWKLWPVGLIIIGVVILINSLKNNNNEQ